MPDYEVFCKLDKKGARKTTKISVFAPNPDDAMEDAKGRCPEGHIIVGCGRKAETSRVVKQLEP